MTEAEVKQGAADLTTDLLGLKKRDFGAYGPERLPFVSLLHPSYAVAQGSAETFVMLRMFIHSAK